jgi:hypothetical protein
LYQHLISETNEDTTSSYSDHQHLQDRRPKQLQYMKATGTSSNTTPRQEDHTLGSSNPTSMNLMEKVSHQTVNEPQNKDQNHQTRNQQHHGHSQRTPAMTTNQRSTTHQQLSRDLHHQQHRTPAIHTTEEDPESYHHQTHTVLASLLFARNSNRLQQIW